MNKAKILENKTNFLNLLRKNVKRQGVEKLMSHLETSDFFTAPASTKYHDSEEGGLCNHSLNVVNYLFQDKDALSKYTTETLTICALLHDICKINFYKISMRNVKDDKTGKWSQEPYYTVNDKLPLGHGEKSVILLMQLMNLTPDEIMAIRWHMGLSVAKDEYGTMSTAFNEYPLALYLHIADMKATYLKQEV